MLRLTARSNIMGEHSVVELRRSSKYLAAQSDVQKRCLFKRTKVVHGYSRLVDGRDQNDSTSQRPFILLLCIHRRDCYIRLFDRKVEQ